MQKALVSFVTTILRRAREAYVWVSNGFLRLFFVVRVFGFVTIISSIIVRNIGAGLAWECAVFGVGAGLTLHFAMKAKKFMSEDK